MGFLEGKRALIVGLASNRSIAWGIAQAMRREGADLAFTYQNEKLEDRVAKMAGELDSEITIPCDVSSDEAIEGGGAVRQGAEVARNTSRLRSGIGSLEEPPTPNRPMAEMPGSQN